MKSRRFQCLLAGWALLVTVSSARVLPGASLEEELERLGLRDVLLLPSQEIDESPVWSPDGRSVAVNLAGTWKRVSLSPIRLERAQWHGGEAIAVVESAVSSPVQESDVHEWQARGKGDPRRIVTSSGVSIELLPVDLGTRFLVSLAGQNPKVLWTTSLENCHSLALSPNERLVAFICELNGLLVTRLRQ
jgi:hypothetical protein